jgi:uracil-DNA glycosylase
MFASTNILNGISEEWLKIIYSGHAKALLDKTLETLECELKFKNEQGVVVKFTPPPDKWFESFRLCPFEKFRVCIVGMDPYPTNDVAHGLSFSFLGSKIPKSLKNIHSCLVKTGMIANSKLKNGDLTRWANQGLLMLNTALSTEEGKSGEHIKIWQEYIYKIIQRMELKTKNSIYYLLWGSHAHKIESLLPIVNDSNRIFKWAHPVAYIASNSDTNFLYCDHFKKLNVVFVKNPIKWEFGDDVKSSSLSIGSSKIETMNMSSKDTDVVNKLSIFDKANKNMIFVVDGSCNPNKKCPEAIGGYAAKVIHGWGKGTEIFGRIDNTKEYASNIRAEGYAILKALEFAEKHRKNWERLIIISDCELWCKMVSHYMPKWSYDKFKSQPNTDLTTAINKLWSDLATTVNTKLADNDINDDFDLISACINNKNEIIHMKSHNKDGWMSFPDGTYENILYHQNDCVDKKATYARVNLSNNEHKCEMEVC